ncbi:MAG TPA: hypothetical protein VHU80_07130 [Polyangiaceae bacterium]|jgi:hypothetical protein|nr:hypothetical protein [Polyangiaceae bacterium]
MRAPRFVPRIVFTSALAGAVPGCHGSTPPDMIVLAVQGFAGTSANTELQNAGGAGGAAAAPSASAPAASASASEPAPGRVRPEPGVIVLAVQGFSGKRPRNVAASH